MLVYFKKYTIFVCIIAVALPVAVSTVWPMLTGQLMASSVLGLVLLFALFVVGFLIGYRIFGRKAEEIADSYISKYNEQCDAEAFVSEGAKLASDIGCPCNTSGAWYLGYYGQALLDVGRVDEARAVCSCLQKSIGAQKATIDKVNVLVNLVPLAEKLEGYEASLELIDQGLQLCADVESKAAQDKEFLELQKKVLTARMDSNTSEEIGLDEKIRSSQAYPMRIRVEYAWDEASALYKEGRTAEEKECLQFVSLHGNKLALAAQAKKRLSSMG